MIATGVSELAPVVGTSAACAALAVSRATSGRGVRRGAKTPPLGRPHCALRTAGLGEGTSYEWLGHVGTAK